MNRLLQLCILAIIIVAPTQYSLQVSRHSFISLIDPIIWFSFAVWLVTQVQERRFSFTRSGLILPAVYVAVVALSLAAAADAHERQDTLKEIFKAVEYFFAAYLVVSGIRDGKTFFTAIRIWLAVACAIVAFGTVHYFSGSLKDMDVSATFGNRNVFGGYLAMMTPVIFAVALWAKTWKVRLALLPFAFLPLFITLSGGTFLALVLSLGAVALVRCRLIFLGYTALILIFSVYVLPELPRHNDEVLRQSISIFDDNYDVNRRYKEWHAAITMAQDKPLLGVGAGNYQKHIGQYYGSLQIEAHAAEPDSQNLYLVILSSTGIAGLLSFAGILLFFMARALKTALRSANDSHRGLAVGLAALIAGFAVNSIWSPLMVRGIGTTLVIALGIITALGQLAEDEARETSC